MDSFQQKNRSSTPIHAFSKFYWTTLSTGILIQNTVVSVIVRVDLCDFGHFQGGSL